MIDVNALISFILENGERVGIVTILLVVAAASWWGLATERIVTGKQHSVVVKDLGTCNTALAAATAELTVSKDAHAETRIQLARYEERVLAWASGRRDDDAPRRGERP